MLANAAAQLRVILMFLLCVACVVWQKEMKHRKFWRLFEVLWHTKANKNGKVALQDSGNMYFCLKGKVAFWCALKWVELVVTEPSYISVVLLQHCFKHVFLPTKKKHSTVLVSIHQTHTVAINLQDCTQHHVPVPCECICLLLGIHNISLRFQKRTTFLHS